MINILTAGTLSRKQDSWQSLVCCVNWFISIVAKMNFKRFLLGVKESTVRERVALCVIIKKFSKTLRASCSNQS